MTTHFAVLESIDWNKISLLTLSKDNILKQMKEELQLFVSTYISLNKVERKILQNTDIPIAACNVRQIISQSIFESNKTNITPNNNNNARYANGAMERALLSQTTNTTTPTDRAVLSRKNCAWCAEPLPRACIQAQNIYCSQKCAEDGRLKRGRNGSTKIRSSVFALEQGVCRKCGVDAHSLFLSVSALDEPCERLNALCNANWRLPVGRIACDRFLRSPKER